jgi:sec-independent protein translocase protein TatC
LAILLSAVVAAFHADILTMAAVAIPIYCMYELSILGIRLFGGSRRPEAEAAAAAVPAEAPNPDPPAHL